MYIKICSSVVVPSRCKGFQSTTYKRPPHTDKGIVWCWVCTRSYTHREHSLIPLLCMWCVFWVESICVCVCGLSNAHCFPDILGILPPCHRSNLSAPCPCTSSSSSSSSPCFSFPHWLWLFFIQSLTVSWWMVPGDEVTVAATAHSLFLSVGIWKVLYFARGRTLLEGISSGRRRWPFHPTVAPTQPA